jgi:hypothetical protein
MQEAPNNEPIKNGAMRVMRSGHFGTGRRQRPVLPLAN